IAALTHDLRTPLNVTKLSAQMLALRLPDQADAQSLLSGIDRSVTHADRLIQDLLDVSHLKSGKPIPVQIAECVPSEIAREVIEELMELHGDRFELNAIDIRVTADPTGLRRIIENLVTNAIKYGAANAPV